jgi:hypothetical protein
VADFDDKSIDRISRAVRWVERQQLAKRATYSPSEFFGYKAEFLEDGGGSEIHVRVYDPNTTDVVPSLEYATFVDEFNAFASVPAGYSLYVWEHGGNLYPLFAVCPRYQFSNGSFDVTDLPDGTVDEPYSESVVPVGTTADAVLAQDLPPGLSVAGDGSISGSPTEEGTFYPVFTTTAPKIGPPPVLEGELCTITRVIPITINPED